MHSNATRTRDVKRACSAVLGALVFGAVSSCATQGPRDPRDWFSPRVDVVKETMILDGDFTDWHGTPTALTVAAPSPLQSVRFRDTPKYLHINLTFRDSVNLQAMPGTLHLLFSGVGAKDTNTVYGVRHVDFSLDLSRLDKLQAGGRGAGFALRPVHESGLGEFRSPYDLEVAALPTWASNEFELRLKRMPRDQFGELHPMFLNFTAVYVGTDSVVHKSATVAHRWNTAPDYTPLARIDTIFAPFPGSFRVAQWNVSEGSFSRPAMHARLLAAVTPDVVMLDEVYEQVTADSLRRFFDLPELKALGPWQFVIAGSGGRQRTVVAARQRNVRPVESMARMQYEPGALDSLKRVFPTAAHRLIEIEEQAQISSVGAWVDINGTDVMFVPLDLQSGGYAGSVHDALRILQARAIRGYIRAEVQARTSFPIVVAGDFNPVGSFQSITILGRDLLNDISRQLRPAHNLRLADYSAVTWESKDAAQFAPGRLDLTYYTGLQHTNGFVFTTQDLSDRLLNKLGMTQDTFEKVADHFIVVSDFKR
ncbi:MAG: hypothetical protein IBJ03_02920 [Gemmatimonadaceae bacterium]|nr:hypothetical protein [Gemmatimonadaceae bacterium]